MAKHRTTEELRSLFVKVVADAEPADPFQFLTMNDVARKADTSASTLAHHVGTVAGLRKHAYAAVVSELETTPSDDVLRSLESQLSNHGSADQIVAAFFAAATRQLSQDPSFTYWIGGMAQHDRPEVIAECHAIRDNLGTDFGRPLRLGLASAGLDLGPVPDQTFVDLTTMCLVTGSLARYLDPDAATWTLRGVQFCAGGVAMAAALPGLLKP